MVHPYAKHSEHHKSRHRVGHIMRSGGAAKHDDVAADKKLFAKLIAQHDRQEGERVGGRVKAKRFARGGKVRHGKGKHQTNIAIVVPHRSPPPTGAGPQAGAGAGPPAMPAPAPGGLPPGGPGGGPPAGIIPPPAGGAPGMPPMRRGGRIHKADGGGTKDKSDASSLAESAAKGGSNLLGVLASGVPGSHKRGGKVPGDATKANIAKSAARARKHSYARGGGLPDAGSETGEGRLQKAHLHK